MTENLAKNKNNDLIFAQKTLGEVLSMHAQKKPDKKAYTFLVDGEMQETSITYKELDKRAKAVAVKLLNMGMSRERVLMFFPAGLEFIVSIFACFYAGVIAVPAYPPRKNKSLSRIKAIVSNSGSKVVMCTKRIFSNIERNFSEEPNLRCMNWLIYDDVDDNLSEDWEDIEIKPEDIALLQYTSGSTGTPKGVMVSHRNIMCNLEFIKQSYGLSENSLSVHWLPAFHDMGLIDGLFSPMYNGFLGILMPPVSFLQKPIRWLNAITRYKATHCGAPNFAYDFCVDKTTEEQRANLNLTSLKTLYNGAEPIRKETLERFISTFKPYGFMPRQFYPTYGMAESTLIISGGCANDNPVYLKVKAEELKHNKIVIASDSDKDVKHLVGVGHPWIDTKVIIVNPNKMIKCNDDEVGEIWISGSIVTQGYWNNPQETKKTFDAYLSDTGEGPFLRTGDLGFYNHGELFVSGRLKDLIIIRGRNYYPQDIEFTVENSHPGLRHTCCAAFSVDVGTQERLVIVQELKRTFIRNLNVEQVCDSIRKSVSEEYELQVYAISLLRTASIPKTSSGKIQRRKCKEKFLDGSLNVVGSWKLNLYEDKEFSETEHTVEFLQQWLVSWLSKKIKVEPKSVNPEKSITIYGLDSMSAVELEQELSEKFSIDVPLYMFFQNISITQLSEECFKLLQKNS